MKCFTGVHVPDPAVYFDGELVKGLRWRGGGGWNFTLSFNSCSNFVTSMSDVC